MNTNTEESAPLDNPSNFINSELSWLKLNRRVLGSADLRTRNCDERVEILFPVEDADIKSAIIKDILNVHLKDNVKARRLLSDGTHERVLPSPGEKELNSEERLIENRGLWHGYF